MSESDERPHADDADEKLEAELDAAARELEAANARAGRKVSLHNELDLVDFLWPVLTAARSLFAMLHLMGLEVVLRDDAYWWYWPRYDADSERPFETFGEAVLDALRWYYQTNPEQQA